MWYFHCMHQMLVHWKGFLGTPFAEEHDTGLVTGVEIIRQLIHATYKLLYAFVLHSHLQHL